MATLSRERVAARGVAANNVAGCMYLHRISSLGGRFDRRVVRDDVGVDTWTVLHLAKESEGAAGRRARARRDEQVVLQRVQLEKILAAHVVGHHHCLFPPVSTFELDE